LIGTKQKRSLCRFPATLVTEKSIHKEGCHNWELEGS